MSTTINIKGTSKTFGDDGVFFIAEIGKNFIQTEEERPTAEYLENAKVLVRAAKESGADAVKFQTHEVEDEVLNIDFTSPHFKAKGSDRYSWVSRNTRATPLKEFWKPLKAFCDEEGIIFFSTPMSRKAARKLEQISVPFWKVGSGDVQDYVMLDFMIETGRPIIISSGMVSLSELDEVIRHIRAKGSELVVLYCISRYPCPSEYFNLATIEHLVEKYPDVVIGFSDHSLEHATPLAAVKYGARVIEKHFSFSRGLWGADHKASLTPKEFKNMVDAVKSREYDAIDVSAFYGEKEKDLEGADNQFSPYFNKALMTGRDIPEGAEIERDMIFAMRPVMYAGGLPANRFYDVVGKRARKELKKYEPITEDVIYHNTNNANERRE